MVPSGGFGHQHEFSVKFYPTGNWPSLAPLQMPPFFFSTDTTPPPASPLQCNSLPVKALQNACRSIIFETNTTLEGCIRSYKSGVSLRCTLIWDNLCLPPNLSPGHVVISKNQSGAFSIYSAWSAFKCILRCYTHSSKIKIFKDATCIWDRMVPCKSMACGITR